ncbi:CIR protein PIR protein [Plasmodium vinckei]|uniref:CIR protein PIR protein n=1 Tax=Plasmodium vinckei TaxID=5860 RepID=A0A6V7TGG2_PLAVN|nr:CIR protein PIR protein [Plasmodium vinckei]
MAKYNIENVYKDINTIDGYFYEMADKSEFTHGSISRYCPYNHGSKYGYCFSYLRMASSVYTTDIEINKFYNNKIKDNGPTYKEIIDTKKDLMNINTKEIYKFNGPFSILCLLYNEIKKNNWDCTKYSEKANEFVQNFEELNEDSNINGNTSYSKLLSTLSDDYNHLKNNYGNNNSCNFPPLPKVKAPPSTLIPVLSTFPVIPVFLGIAYKYSLFGVDKLFQRQYLRKKLKKVKKKLKLNI